MHQRMKYKYSQHKGEKMADYNQPSLEQLEKALKIAARVVVLYGEAYISTFNRLHEEAERMKADQSKENLAILLVKKYADME
jgi:hypothetical protein